ncbi:hypothetical protein C2845_PM08G04890 [Panicum miliaceum]|uniref:Uncharacterized protein n=1 Tax=Panicum miliaceum TaxID=4540 RepID=A0A3L6R1V7_PANMI|nr:hypothetical protein C2845_PM08G04890 [Panicum miliaceum]
MCAAREGAFPFRKADKNTGQAFDGKCKRALRRHRLTHPPVGGDGQSGAHLRDIQGGLDAVAQGGEVLTVEESRYGGKQAVGRPEVTAAPYHSTPSHAPSAQPLALWNRLRESRTGWWSPPGMRWTEASGAADREELDRLHRAQGEGGPARSSDAPEQRKKDWTPEERIAAAEFIRALIEDYNVYAAMTEDDVEEEYRRAGKLDKYDPERELQKRGARVAKEHPPPAGFYPKLEQYFKLGDDEEDQGREEILD